MASKTEVASKLGLSLPGAVSAGGSAAREREAAVTESEVRQQTEESVFNGLRQALLDVEALTSIGADWGVSEWEPGTFVELRPQRFVVPLLPVVSRLKALVESVAYAAKALSPDVLEKRIPQLLDQFDEEAAADADSVRMRTALGWAKELGEVAQVAAGLLKRVEDEAAASGLIDLLMFPSWRDEPHDEHEQTTPGLVVCSLDREYVDTKLLRRLGQGRYGVLGKVLRPPEQQTALNPLRNTMLGSTNQFPVKLQRVFELLRDRPLIFGDSVMFGETTENAITFDFSGSASAWAELSPLWLSPSVEIFPIAIYA